MKIVARAGAIFMPIASPHSCVNASSSNLKTLLFNTYFKRSNRKTMSGNS